MQLYTEYIKEREGYECLYESEAFVTYKINGNECYIRDIYVTPGARKKGLAARLTKHVEKIARQKGCEFLTGTVQPGTVGDTVSLKAQLAYGFELNRIVGDVLILVKELGEESNG